MNAWCKPREKGEAAASLQRAIPRDPQSGGRRLRQVLAGGIGFKAMGDQPGGGLAFTRADTRRHPSTLMRSLNHVFWPPFGKETPLTVSDPYPPQPPLPPTNRTTPQPHPPVEKPATGRAEDGRPGDSPARPRPVRVSAARSRTTNAIRSRLRARSRRRAGVWGVGARRPRRPGARNFPSHSRPGPRKLPARQIRTSRPTMRPDSGPFEKAEPEPLNTHPPSSTPRGRFASG